MIVSAVSNQVLMVTIANGSKAEREAERKGRVAQIRDVETGEVYGYNFFDISDIVDTSTDGVKELTVEEVSDLNKEIEAAGFTPLLEVDGRPKFVVGLVKECEPMEGSDHLKITQTEIDQGEVLQIVCGAPNVEAGQKVVVAKEGAVMPDGLVIWAGKLHKADSHGMICSAKELQLENAPQKRGILVLDDERQAGEAFEF